MEIAKAAEQPEDGKGAPLYVESGFRDIYNV